MVGGSPRKLLLALACILCCAAFAPAFASAAGTGSIHGTVTEVGTDAPIEDSQVCAFEEGGEGVQACAETDDEGEYVVEELPEGDYTVEFTGSFCSAGNCAPEWGPKLYDEVLPGSEGGDPTPVHVTEGDRTQEIDAELELLGGIAGTVESASGPIPHTLVCVNSRTQYHPACAFTDEDGEYEVPELPPGEFDIDFTGRVCEAGGSGCSQESCEAGESCPRAYVEQFYEEELNNEVADLVEVHAGEVTEPIDATLVAGGRIEGTVTLAALGDPALSDVTACAFSDESFNGSCGSTNEAGKYVIEGLGEAPFMVEFKASCTEEPCPETYVEQFYDGEATEEEATQIQVTTGQATTGIDARMVLAHPQSPAFTTGPTLSGNPSVGSTLSCLAGTWSNFPTGSAYAWQRNGAAIMGQTGSTYVVGGADEGASLTCAVTVSNSAGSVSAASNSLSVPAHKDESKPAESTPPASSPPPPPKLGKATATGNATASGNTVTLSLKCTGKGACEGTLKLVYETKVKNAKGKTTLKKVTIATASFKLAAGKTKAIKAKLTSKGATLLAGAGKAGLKVKLTGSGVKARTLTVKAAARRSWSRRSGRSRSRT